MQASAESRQRHLVSVMLPPDSSSWSCRSGPAAVAPGSPCSWNMRQVHGTQPSLGTSLLSPASWLPHCLTHLNKSKCQLVRRLHTDTLGMVPVYVARSANLSKGLYIFKVYVSSPS